MRTTTSKALEVILNLTPLRFCVRMEATRASYRPAHTAVLRVEIWLEGAKELVAQISTQLEMAELLPDLTRLSFESRSLSSSFSLSLRSSFSCFFSVGVLFPLASRSVRVPSSLTFLLIGVLFPLVSPSFCVLCQFTYLSWNASSSCVFHLS